MTKSSIHEQIATLCEKISFLNEKLSNEKKLHPVELDLLNGYVKELQGLVSHLPQAKPELTVVKKEEATAVASEKKTEPEPVRAPEGNDEKEIKLHQHILQKADEACLTEDPEELIETDANTPPVKVEAVEEILVKKKPEAKQPAKQTVSLNEKFKKETTALADKLKGTKKKSLKDAFDLNERYRIIETLFKGSAEQFNHAIQDLGKCATREEAELYIKKTESKFAWNKNPELAGKFREQALSFIQ